MSARTERGFVAVEWVAAVALLLLPVIIVVAMLPIWAERRQVASLAAIEAAKVLADAWPHADVAAAVAAARGVARDHGVDDNDVSVRVESTGRERGDDVFVRVSMRMPAISVMGVNAGEWHCDAVATRRIDDYRSR